MLQMVKDHWKHLLGLAAGVIVILLKNILREWVERGAESILGISMCTSEVIKRNHHINL